MTCPQCHDSLNKLEVSTTDGQVRKIDECLNCGGHFLDNYLVNFISVETARNIDSVLPKKHLPTVSEPKCFHCGQVMFAISDDSTPKTVTVYNCPNNHGDFFPKGQLLLFKKAQDAKINYHKLWGIPLKTAFSVIIPLFIIFTSVTVLPSVVKELNQSTENRVKASEILTEPLITPISDNQVLISFSTKNKVSTNLIFTSGINKTFTVSEQPKTSHLVSIENLPPATTFKYTIVIDPLGKNLKTSEYSFSTP